MTTTTAAPPKPPARPAPQAQPAQLNRPAAPASAEGEGGDGGFAALLQQTQDASTQDVQAADADKDTEPTTGTPQADPAALLPNAAPRGYAQTADNADAAPSPRQGGASSRSGHSASPKPAASSAAAGIDTDADADQAAGVAGSAAGSPGDAAAALQATDAAALAAPTDAQRLAEGAPPTAGATAAWAAPADAAAAQAALQAALVVDTAAASATDASLPTQALPGAFAQAELDAHPAASGFAGALGAQLRAWVEGGVAQARLHLNPRELGPIEVRIALHQGRTRLDLHAQAASTREAIERALPQLQALVAASVADVGVALARAGNEAGALAAAADGALDGSGQRGQGEQERKAQGEPTARMAHRLSQVFAQAQDSDTVVPPSSAPRATGLDLYA